MKVTFKWAELAAFFTPPADIKFDFQGRGMSHNDWEVMRARLQDAHIAVDAARAERSRLAAEVDRYYQLQFSDTPDIPGYRRAMQEYVEAGRVLRQASVALEVAANAEHGARGSKTPPHQGGGGGGVRK